MNNEIKHVCQFCKKGEVTLSLAKLDHKCECGVVYTYRPNTGTTYERKPAKTETPPEA